MSPAWRDASGSSHEVGLIYRDFEVSVPVGHCDLFGVIRGSRSVGLPCSPLDLGPSPTWSSGSSRSSRTRPTARCRQCCTFWPPVITPRDLWPLLQSAHSPARAPRDPRRDHELVPLMGSARLPPLCRSTFRASTPGSRGFLWPDGANRPISFRPRGLSPPRRFAPRRGCGSIAPRCRL